MDVLGWHLDSWVEMSGEARGWTLVVLALFAALYWIMIRRHLADRRAR